MNELDAATLVIAIIGALTGVVALIWNVTAFVFSGPRVKVAITEGATNATGMITGAKVWSGNLHAGFGQMYPIVAIEVTNKGRFPVTISNVTAKTSSGVGFSSTEDMNHRLDPYSSNTWRLPLEDVMNMVDTASKVFNMSDRRVRGIATLATGKKVKSSGSLTIPFIPN